eukprot:GHVP01058364.1.p1 GENE.GHVP01058364.1~~GHVP01058364.1.p1  ORF type:complete len:413 (+),score=35.70 GHVP01058364.1:66-1304(+)
MMPIIAGKNSFCLDFRSKRIWRSIQTSRRSVLDQQTIVPANFLKQFHPRLMSLPPPVPTAQFEEELLDSYALALVPLTSSQLHGSYFYAYNQLTKNMIPAIQSRLPAFPPEDSSCSELIVDTIDPKCKLRKDFLMNFQPRSSNPITALTALKKTIKMPVFQSTLLLCRPSTKSFNVPLDQQTEFRIAIQELPTSFISDLLEAISNVAAHPLMESFLTTTMPSANRPSEIRMAIDNDLGIDTTTLCSHAIKAVANGLIRRAKMDRSQSRTRELVKNDQLLMFSLIIGLGFPNAQETLRSYIAENLPPGLTIEEVDPWIKGRPARPPRQRPPSNQSIFRPPSHFSPRSPSTPSYRPNNGSRPRPSNPSRLSAQSSLYIPITNTPPSITSAMLNTPSGHSACHATVILRRQFCRR